MADPNFNSQWQQDRYYEILERIRLGWTAFQTGVDALTALGIPSSTAYAAAQQAARNPSSGSGPVGSAGVNFSGGASGGSSSGGSSGGGSNNDPPYRDAFTIGSAKGGPQGLSLSVGGGPAVTPQQVQAAVALLREVQRANAAGRSSGYSQDQIDEAQRVVAVQREIDSGSVVEIGSNPLTGGPFGIPTTGRTLGGSGGVTGFQGLGLNSNNLGTAQPSGGRQALSFSGLTMTSVLGQGLGSTPLQQPGSPPAGGGGGGSCSAPSSGPTSKPASLNGTIY